MRDALFPDAKGQPVGEKASLPTRFLKNLDYGIEATSTQKYPFLANLQVELEGGQNGPVNGNPVQEPLDQRYVITMDFVQTEGSWRLYYSRLLSPTALAEDLAEKGQSGPMKSFQELLDLWTEYVPYPGT